MRSAEYPDELFNTDVGITEHGAQRAGRDVASGMNGDGRTATIGMFEYEVARAALAMLNKSDP